jgi:hypothetical protein
MQHMHTLPASLNIKGALIVIIKAFLMQGGPHPNRDSNSNVTPPLPKTCTGSHTTVLEGEDADHPSAQHGWLSNNAIGMPLPCSTAQRYCHQTHIAAKPGAPCAPPTPLC